MSRKDWLLLVVVFAASAILGIWALQMIGHPTGWAASMGSSLLFAVSASAVCAGFWRLQSYSRASKAIHITAIIVLLIIAAVAFLFGGKFNGQALLYVARHGMPNWSGFSLQGVWAWVFIPALGIAYIQLWTLVRLLLNTGHRS